MSKHYLLAVLFLSCMFTTKAQQTTFRIQYDIAIFDLPGGIAQSPTGNYVIAGTNASFGTIGNLTQLSPSGTVQWCKGYSAGGLSTQFSDVKNISGGGFIVTGGTGSGCLLAKIDASGNVVWANRYRVSSSTGSNEYGNRVIQTSDGGFVVAGSVDRVDPDGAGPIARQDSSKMFAMKADASGNLLWMRTFFYTTAFDDDDFLQDVAEVSDGYVFVGEATIVAGDGQSDATMLKTDFSGNLQWARRWGNSNSEAGYAIINTGSNAVLISGDDNGRAFLLNVNTPNAGPSVTGTNSIYTTAGFSALGSSLMKTFDNNYSIIGTRIGATFTPPFLDYSAFILKTNASTGAVIFNRAYNSGFVSILPVGIQTSDSGYIMNSISATLTGTSYDYGVVKADKNGQQASGSGCTETSPTFTRASYSPTLNSFSSSIVTTGAASTTGITAANVTPGTNVVCLTVACTAPVAPTVAATPSTFCNGQSSSITASGGSNVTYRIYTAPTGGTSIGSAPFSVSPSATTTYYVAADDNSNPGCMSARVPVTVTVNNPPSAVGSIVGSAAPCLGSAAYSIAATGATNYVWSISGGGSITSGQGTANINVNWVSSGGPYTLSVAVSNSCGTVNRTLTVNVVAGVSGVSATATPNPACIGGTVTLNGAGNGVNNWAWTGPNGYSSSSQSPQLTGLTSLQAGTYNLTASSACGSGSSSVTLVINNVPQLVTASANPNPACAGNTVNLTGSATNATSWSWSGPNTFTASTQNASVSNAQAIASGTYTLTATNACGNATGTVNVTVNQAPTAVTASANPNPVCAGTTLTLSGAATGAASYSWTGPNSFTSSQLNNTITNFQAVNVGTYVLTATNSCGSSQSSAPVALATVPTNVSASANLTNICTNANLVLSGNANDASSFSWTGPNAFSSNLQNPTVSNVILADSGLYTLTATNACGTSTASVNVDVDAPITTISTSAAPDDTVCAGATINLSASGAQVNTWAWTGPNSFTSSQPGASIPNSSSANSGTYTVLGTNACGSSSSSVAILVNTAIQNLTASAASNNICTGANISLTATGTQVNTYSWTGPNGFNSNQQNPSISPANTNNSGTYTVSANNACGSSTNTVNVQVDTLIQNISSNASPNDTICAGGTLNLAASGSNVNTWAWTGPNNFNSNQQNPSITNATSAASGSYNLIATNACGNAQSSLVVLVNDPILNLTASASSNGVICTGSSIALSVSSSTATAWTWSGPNGFSSTLQNPSINPANTNNNGTYSVTAANACGSQTATVSVQVDTLIQNFSASASPNDTICEGGTVNLSVSGINVTSWTWTGPNGFTSAQQNATINNATAANTGTYSVIGSNACGTASSSVNVFVKSVPASPINITGAVSPCGSTTATYTVTGSANVSSYNWTLSGGGSIVSGQGTGTVTIDWSGIAGNFILSVTATNECGTSNAATKNISVDVPTILGITATSDTICYNTTTTLTANVSPAGTAVTWYITSTGGAQIASGASFTTDALIQTTTYFAEATSVGGCANVQGRIPTTVVVTPLPVVTLVSDHANNVIFQNEVLIFIALPDSFDNYEFFRNNSSVQNSSSHTYSSSSYVDKDSVWVIATENGCRSMRSAAVVQVVDFPNAFTPNSDGVNDIFLKGYDLIVENRWGQLMYQGKDGWDGTFNGTKVSAGTYYYIVTLVDIDDRPTTIKGTVLVVLD